MNHPKESIVNRYLPRLVRVATLAVGAVMVAALSVELESLTGRKWGGLA